MHDFIEQLKSMDRNQLILAAAKLKKESLPEPIAVVGIGCRFAGGIHSANSFWDKISTGLDAVEPIADKRWKHSEFFSQDPDEPGKSYVQHMALLDQADSFDAAFFNIHKTEADLMDPQQRWLLEDSWHALEDANLDPRSLTERNVGVFVGLMNHDYEHLQNLHGDMSKVTGYSAVGSATSVAAGRLAYFFGFQGPTLSLDTACSSSLVSVHLACQALRQKECTLALAGGVNAILSPTTTIAESKALMLSPTGKCHTYDQKADGYVRGEGCGMLVLKRLQDAKKDGDRIYAVIRGSAVNQDGASQGLTSPNGLAQQRVIAQALEQANIDAVNVGFVETHGTGTPLGDPIEIGALCKAYQTDHRAHPLYISSIKTNLGHTESAAGAAGLIKLCLSRYHNTLVHHRNLETLNQYIDLNGQNLQILKQNSPWPSDTPFGAISSFGFSGTNAHIIVGPPPEPDANESQTAATNSELPQLITASAAHPEALTELAKRYQHLMESNGATAIATASHHCRAHLPHRLAWRVGSAVPNLAPRRSGTQRMCALFSGQGAQAEGMGQAYFKHFAVFRETVEACDHVFTAHYGYSICDVLWGERSDQLNQTQFTQPALYVYELAMARLWHHWGVRPSVLLGHSVGEYAAACYAGVFSLEDGMRLIIARGETMQNLCETGAMAAVKYPREPLEELLQGYRSSTIAVFNGSDSHVVSGPIDQINDLVSHCQSNDIRCQRLRVSHGFHSAMMEPMLNAFSEVAQQITYRMPSIPIISSLTGDIADKQMADPNYWVDHVRDPVQFAKAAQSAIHQKINNWLEIGPDHTLCGLVRGMVENDGDHAWFCLQKSSPKSAQEQLVDLVANLYMHRWDINWKAFDESHDLRAAKRSVLPLYPFQATQYWFTPERVFTHLSHQGNDQTNVSSHVPNTNEQTAESTFIERLRPLSNEDQWLALVSLTRKHIAVVLNIEEEEVPLDVDLFDLGLDSMKAMDLRATVQQELGYDLSARLLFDHPNVLSLVDYFGLELLKLWQVSPLAEELANQS